VSPVKYELGFYIPEDDILHSHCRGNIKAYIRPAVLKPSDMAAILNGCSAEELKKHVVASGTNSDSPCFEFRTGFV
jgi:hypothetical protein